MFDFSRYVITTHSVGPYHIIIFQNPLGDLLNMIIDIDIDIE